MSQPHQNGKGSRRRPGKPGAYEEGWERVFGRKRGETVIRENGQTVTLSANPSLLKELNDACRSDSASSKFGRKL